MYILTINEWEQTYEVKSDGLVLESGVYKYFYEDITYSSSKFVYKLELNNKDVIKFQPSLFHQVKILGTKKCDEYKNWYRALDIAYRNNRNKNIEERDIFPLSINHDNIKLAILSYATAENTIREFVNRS